MFLLTLSAAINVSLVDKVTRLTNLTVLLNSQLKDELSTSVGDLKHKIRNFRANLDGRLTHLDGQLTQLTDSSQRNHDAVKTQLTQLSKTAESNNSQLVFAAQKSVESLSFHRESLALHRAAGQTLEVGGKFHRLLLQETQFLLDHMTSELGMTREISLKKRVVRQKVIADFHITNFSQWAGSGRAQFSHLWYIDQAGTHVKAMAVFGHNRQLHLNLVHGRAPLVLGAAPVGAKAKIKVKATISNPLGGGSGTVEIQEKGQWCVHEARIGGECCGWEIADTVTSFNPVCCDELESQNLIDADKVCIRFEINVLK